MLGHFNSIKTLAVSPVIS